MRAKHAWLLLLAIAMCTPVLFAQPGNFPTSLHNTRAGKDFWYSAANGGFEAFTNIPVEQIGCKECHGPADADGNPYGPDYSPGCSDCHAADFSVQVSQCISCHSRQKTESMVLNYSDVHRDAGMVCWDCHGTGDMHGDGVPYQSMLEPSAINVECEDCHDSLPAVHLEYDPHGGALHCKACHTQTVISCYNCHFESQVEAHLKRAKQPIHDFVILVNREEDGKVHPATFQSVTYQGDAFAAFAPYTAHTIGNGRNCKECHYNFGGANAAIGEYNQTGRIKFASLNDMGMLSWVHGIVPMPEEYQARFKMDFITYDGNVTDPPGPSTNWSKIGKDKWDGSQMFFATPLSREQMRSLGFADTVYFDIKPESCDNPIGASSKGLTPAIIVGTADMDVAQIDVASLELEGISPRKVQLSDMVTPIFAEGELCQCPEMGPDGYDDLKLKFPTDLILQALGPVAKGEERILTITGSMLDGTPIVGNACVTVRGQSTAFSLME